MAEELALEQVLVERRAVDGHEPLAPSRAVVVDGARHQLLAGPRLALDQHAHGAVARALHQAPHFLHGGTRGDDAVELVLRAGDAAEGRHLALQRRLARPQLADETRVLDRDRDAARERVEQREILRPEAADALVDDLDHADHAVAGAQRSADEALGGPSETLVDAAVEACVGRRVVDQGGGRLREHPAGHAAVVGNAQVAQTAGVLLVPVVDVRELQVLAARVEQHDGGALRPEDLLDATGQVGEQLVQVEERREHLADLVEEGGLVRVDRRRRGVGHRAEGTLAPERAPPQEPVGWSLT